MTVRLERVSVDEVPWSELDTRPDRTVFQTREWLEFLRSTQHAEPVAAQLFDGDRPVGWFSGAVVRRGGLPVLGSPLPGWSTSYMGFTTDRSDLGWKAISALADFAFRSLGCVHFEVMDRNLSLTPDSEALPRAVVSPFRGYQLELRDDATMLSGMSPTARRNIRRSESKSVVVEEVDQPGFAEFVTEYYSQVTKVFAKRQLVPTFPIERVESLIQHLHPTGHLLLLRARTAEGLSVATGIFPGIPRASAGFYMGASEVTRPDVRPNEAVMWHAIRTWRDRGSVSFDFGGGGEYKAKFGGAPIVVPWVRWSKYRGMDQMRNAVRSGSKLAQRVRGRLEAPRGG
ncbi:MAG: GNAT family N-acetyltransferase [Microthrixaceae bacterium]